MSHQCDDPNCSGHAPKSWIKKQIKKHGVAVINVFPGECLAEPWFHYTIGNHSAGLPEILAIGGHSRESASGISGAVSHLASIMRKRGKPFEEGELVSLGGKYPVKVVNAEGAKLHCTLQVEHYYGTIDYAVQRMVLPDPAGKFPGDLGCAEPYASYSIEAVSGPISTH
jgi:hypothetical protein